MNPSSSRATREVVLNHDSNLRFRRGGAWAYSPGNAQYASRHAGFLWNRNHEVGVRLVEGVQEEADPPSRSTSARWLRGSSWYNSRALSPVPYRFNRGRGNSPHDFGGFRLVEETDPPSRSYRGDRFNRGVLP